MPTSSRMIDSTIEDQSMGGGSSSSTNNSKCPDTKHNELPQQKGTKGLSNITETSAHISGGPSVVNDADTSSKVKEEPLNEVSNTLESEKLGNDHDFSGDTSLQEGDSSKVAATRSSPSRAPVISRNYLFSPPLQSNHRVDYDQLDLNDTIMGMGFEFDESSPPRDLARSPRGSEPAEEPVTNSVPKKRRLSELDRPSLVKRSHLPHHRYHSRAQDGPSTNAGLSSTSRSGGSPGYQNSYRHSHQFTTYNGESRTPSRGNAHHGVYHSGYSPYYSHQSHERSQWDNQSVLSPGLGTPKVVYPPFESDEQTPSSPSSLGARTSSKAAEASTPEKNVEKRPARSPFRSPRRDLGCSGSEAKNEAFRPSPYLKRPNLSFDIDTPTGTLPTGDYSPMGPSFEGLYEDASTPFKLDESFFGGSLMGINRSPSQGNSEGTSSPPSSRRDRRPQRSPMSPDVSELLSFDQSNAIHGDPRPSLQYDCNHDISSDRRYHHSKDHKDIIGLGSAEHPKASAVTISDRKGEAPSSRLDPGAQPKQLWPSKNRTQGPVRLEIGGTGPLNTRKTLEGINSMMQQSSTNHNKNSVERNNGSSGYGTIHGRIQPPSQHQRSSHHPYGFGELATPSKGYSHIRPGHGRGRHSSYPPPVGPSMKPMYPRKIDHSNAGVRPPKPIYMSHFPPRDNKSLHHQHNPVPPSIGKENSKKKTAPKRKTCNCKKSKCLKLYCECFGAERFCNGCNCLDCRNTPEFEEERKKAIKDTRAKNSKAFQQKIVLKNSQGAEASQKVHNSGCKCKKSQCLKKYCECFNAGAFCGEKCKCQECKNHPGSQQLADKRNKMKDPVGAQYAMRVSHEQWKSGSSTSSSKPVSQPHRRQPIPSPVVGMPPPHHMVHPNQRGYPAQGSRGYPLPQHSHRVYMGPHARMIPHGHHHMGYSPMSMSVPHGYHQPPRRMPPGEGISHRMHHGSHSSRPPSTGNSMPTPKLKSHTKRAAGSPRTPGVRKPFDPATNRKKRKITPGELEPTEPYFGHDIPEQPKIAGLAVFSFLSNDDLYHASLVCKSWSKLAMDEELWKFQ